MYTLVQVDRILASHDVLERRALPSLFEVKVRMSWEPCLNM